MVPMYPLSCSDCLPFLFGALRLSIWYSLRMGSPPLQWGKGTLYLPKKISTSLCVSGGVLLGRYRFYKA